MLVYIKSVFSVDFKQVKIHKTCVSAIIEEKLTFLNVVIDVVDKK